MVSTQRTVLAAVVCSLMFTTGCMQFAANLLHVVSGPQIPAEFKGLENKKVAIVCTNEMGVCRDETTIRLAGNLKGILASRLPKSTFINQDEIDRWLEGSAASDQDVVSIGKGVKADYVIAADVLNLQLKDGPTLYRGRSDLSIRVWDVSSGKPVFAKQYPSHAYPTMGGQSTTETDENQFRRVYLVNVADKLARHFYAHDFGEEVALDATISKY